MEEKKQQTLKEYLEEMDKEGWAPEERRVTERRMKEREKLYLPTQRAKLVRDSVLRVETVRGPITNTRRAVAIFGEFFRDCHIEMAAIMALNVNKEYLGTAFVGRGTFDRVNIDTVEIIGHVWAYRAAYFIIAHNHPSGNVNPSPEDLEMLKEINGLAVAHNRPMKDFMIIGYDEEGNVKYYSHRDQDYEL